MVVAARHRSNISSEILRQSRLLLQSKGRVLIMAGALIVLMGIVVLKSSQEAIAILPGNSGYGMRVGSSGIRNSVATPTGMDLNLPVCGMTWEQYYEQLPPGNPKQKGQRPIQWTISGGDEYRDNLSIILEKWRTLGIDPILLIALDVKTAEMACHLGYSAVHWDADAASYSRVADAKFGVAASIAERGYRSFFMEMDVFCRKNPVPLFLNENRDLVSVGHGDVGYNTNTGSFLASAKTGPFFRGLLKVLSYSLENPKYTNQINWTINFFEQSIYHDCLILGGQNEDDDVTLDPWEYYLLSDTERKHNLLLHCREVGNFSHTHLPHHIMSNHDPPVVYDSTYCIHPLVSKPLTPLAYKMGVAKFYGWDPKPFGPSEKFLKLTAGDLESNNCWNRCFEHSVRMNEFTFYDKVAMYISVMVEIAERTRRTLILPQYIRDKDSWALPTHAIVDVTTLGVPYRVMPPHEFHNDGGPMADVDTAVVFAAHNFSETFRRATDKKYASAKVLSIMKICNVRDYKLPVLEDRRNTMSWCFDRDQEWQKDIGGWMSFCEAGRP